MGEDQQRWRLIQLLGVIARRVEEAVGTLATRAQIQQPLGARQIGVVQRTVFAQQAGQFTGGQFNAQNGGGAAGRRADAIQRLAVTAQVTKTAVGVGQPPLFGADRMAQRQMAVTGLAPAQRHPAVLQRQPGVAALLPRCGRVIGGNRRQLARAVSRNLPGHPIATAVRQAAQLAAGIKARLLPCVIRAADRLRRRDTAVVGQRCPHQPGARPAQIGAIPFDPRQLRAVITDLRAVVKVSAAGEQLACAVQSDGDQPVLYPTRQMRLFHRQHAAARKVGAESAVAAFGATGQWFKALPFRALQIQLLIGFVDEYQQAVGFVLAGQHTEAAAAVLIHAAAYGMALGGNGAGDAVLPTLQHAVTLLRAEGQPPERAVGAAQIAVVSAGGDRLRCTEVARPAAGQGCIRPCR